MRSLAIAVAIAACSSDPTLHVVVVQTTDVKVSSTTISVYDSKTLTCQAIEYGDVDASALSAALVAEETIDANGKVTAGSLANLPRTDDKLVVARGYDDTMELVAAGCADKGVVSGSDKVEVDTVATAVVSIALADPTGQQDVYGISLTVTDVNGSAIDGRQVWWRAYGPGGFAPNSEASGLDVVQNDYWEPMQPSCTKNGAAVVHPVPPDLIGGFAIELRVAWSVDPPQQFTSFTKLEDLQQSASASDILTLNVPTVGQHVCTRHVTAAGATLACLDGGSSPSAYDVTVTYANGATTFTKGSAVPGPASKTTIGLYGVDNGSTRDVYFATADCAAVNVFGSGGGHFAGCPGGTADDILYVPACGSSGALLLFHTPKVGGATVTPGSILAIDLATPASPAVSVPLGYKNAEDDVAFNAAGCVTELAPGGGSPTQRQVIAIDYLTPTLLGPAITATRAVFGCPANCTAAQLPVAGGGVGFVTDAGESRFIVPTVDATGVQLAQLVLLPGSTSERLVERTTSPAAAIPDQIVSGSFDNDNGVDLLWDISAKRGTAFEVSYARTVAGQRLTALSGASGFNVKDMIVGDVTGDQKDDVTVTSQAGSLRFVATVPLQVKPPHVALMADSTCAP